MADEKKIQAKMGKATRWSAITEVMAKLVAPVSNMVLARFISPAAFGIVAVVNMVLSFAEVFADAGFQKYLVQHEFQDVEEKHKSATVAFWTNIIVSAVLFTFIVVFRNPISGFLGSPGNGTPIAVGSVSLFLIAFSSIQMALFKREFDFKKLFIIRIFAILVPFIVTIPLAILKFSYWSLIIGTITTNVLNAILLTIFSKWKPRFFYSFKLLKEMFSFTFLTMLESLTVWLSLWMDSFIIGRYFNDYYRGLYRNANSMVSSIMALITASIVPVLFAALSRLQNDEKGFNNTFLKTQKLTAMLVLPMGVGLFIFRELATWIALGDQWMEAALVLGLNGLMYAFKIIFSDFNSEVFRAKGKPLLSMLLQIIHLAFLIPLCIFGAKKGFTDLVYMRAITRIQMMVTSLLFMRFVVKFPVGQIFKRNMPVFVATAVMGVAAYFLQRAMSDIWWQFVAIIICIIIYAGMLFAFPSTRKVLLSLIKKVYNRFIGFKDRKKLKPVAAGGQTEMTDSAGEKAEDIKENEGE